MKLAYFTDENGNMLSVAEIREHLIAENTGRFGIGHKLLYQQSGLFLVCPGIRLIACFDLSPDYNSL
jgi:hypothetical protein